MKALIVRGGWEGHAPVESTSLFIDFLAARGFAIDIRDQLAAYDDPALLASADLIVQCWTNGGLTASQERNLVDRVRSGAGLAGWHGGITAFGYENPQYQYMIGGRFVFHPGGFVEHSIGIAGSHPITAGLGGYRVHTEQYFCHVDPSLTVLATTEFAGTPDAPETAGVTMPVVWTRHFGAGRVFVCTLGHSPADLRVPQTRTITERGLLWAAGALNSPQR
ncbi:ThuA domain-containing protein [Actinoplanes sp. DH11]|uniref:ThuA domain-containing protein n=1 Tax=Actinoplanes sp. DH11 TaxID=2857011 RepID=UPI001E3F434B|nr:ThuA domain-containing protein [Actinoplanes sp. DH11]